MGKLFLLFFLITSIQAYADGEKDKFSITNYTNSKDINKKDSMLAGAVSQKENLITVKVSNVSGEVIPPVFPIDVQFLDNQNYQLVKDSCSYQSLAVKQECLIVIKQIKDYKMSLNIAPYGKQGFSVNLGSKILKLPKVTLPTEELRLASLPLVEKIGVGNSYSWDILLSDKTINQISAINDNEKYFLKAYLSDNIIKLQLFPKLEDLYEVDFKLNAGSKIIVIPAKFTAIVRKPLRIKISPNVTNISVNGKPVALRLEAEYFSGTPKTAVIPNYFIDWGSNVVNEQGLIQTIKEGKYEIKVKFLGLESNYLKVNIQQYWPYGKDNSLLVKTGERKILNNYMQDFSRVEVQPGGLLEFKHVNPWTFLGVKDNFINNGTVKFYQKLTGDLSSNIPNFDGSLSGQRIVVKTQPNASVIQGGFLYINASQISGKGKFQVNPDTGNQGKVFLYYRKNQKVKLQNFMEEHFYEDPVTLKKDVQEQENISPANDKMRLLRDFNRPEWWISISVYSLLRYIIAAGIMFLTLYYVLNKKLYHKKIQDKQPVNNQIKRELIYSFIGTFIVSLVVTTVSLSLFDLFSVFKVYNKISDHGIGYYFFSFFLIILMHDIYFYVTHRLMHTKWLFSKIHAFHHQSSNPTPLTSFSFTIWESIVQLSFLPIALAIFPFHVTIIGLFLWTTQIQNAYIHCGYSFRPQLLKNKWFYWLFGNPVHHNVHHEYSDGNYGLYFNFLDIIFKTNSPHYKDQGPEGNKKDE